jgi:hypothetical protein
LELGVTYNSANRQVTIVTTLHYTTNDTASTRLTILLTEDSITTAQLNGSVIDTNYIHNDVLRNVITGTEGDDITQTRKAGLVVQKVYQATLDTLWNAANINVIGFVHDYVSDKVIYQAKEVRIP